MKLSVTLASTVHYCERGASERYDPGVNGATRTSTRDIARAAIRAELAQVAFELFRREGFENVTVNDLAAAAGVSRSTFLRYFGTKEDAVLDAVDAQGGRIADALRNRPAGEDDWTALRHALGTVVEHHRQDPAGALALSRLIMKTPALCARSMEKQNGWRPVIAEALAGRAAPSRSSTLGPLVRAAAAVDCLNIAVNHWTASDGTLDLDDLIDEAFAALAPR
ncbi:TetR family transcriptional regulator [Streptomyces mirabilis]|nr:TetR family transcriptional regulator [Streptomyces sp. RLB1-33]QUW78916.1 TetR family transcriptional regulator [Streptomyces mirabilis]